MERNKGNRLPLIGFFGSQLGRLVAKHLPQTSSFYSPWKQEKGQFKRQSVEQKAEDLVRIRD